MLQPEGYQAMSEYTDKQLLEWAAKAAGFIELRYDADGHPRARKPNGVAGPWNPIDCMVAAKNLRHTLKMTTGYDDRFFGHCAYATYSTGPDSCNSIMQSIEDAGGKRKALRLAITRAAAEIGRAMP